MIPVIPGLVALALTLVLAAPAPAFTVRDMHGREVTLPAPPRRIVSLVPSATEVIYAVGGGDRLAGRTDYCDYPPAARGKPSVGTMLSPSLEMIVALKADLVIVTSAGNREETFAQLSRLGIPVYMVEGNSVADVRDLVTRLAALTSRAAAAAPLLATFDRRIDAVRAAVAPFPVARVLYALWPEPLIVPGAHSLITELIRLAGGISVTASEHDRYPRFSVEAALARAPDVIVLADHGAPPRGEADAASRAQWARLGGLAAIRAARTVSIDGNLLHRYGPRIADGLEMLARAIHPEAFR